MMLKMLIVDDEPIICQGLIETIPWKDIGVEVVGTAEHGKEALSFMHQDNIDLVLTDVYMPEMDGLELSKYISRKFPESKIIIMSGYDEFEYARQAIRLGVEDYLLKPVDIDDLLELVEKVRQTIINKKKETKLLKKELITKQILHYLFGSPISTQELADGEKITSSYRLLISELGNYYVLKRSSTEKERTKLKNAWKLQIDQAFAVAGLDSISMFGHENELITIQYNIDQSHLTGQQMEDVCESIDQVKGHLLRRVVSTKQQNLSDISQLRGKVQTILENVRTDDERFIIMGEESKQSVQTHYPKTIVSQLQKAILKLDEALMDDLLKDLFNRFAEEGLTLRQVLDVSSELATELKNRLHRMHFMDRLAVIHLVLHKNVDLKIYNSHQAIKDLLKTDMSDLAEAINSKSDHHWLIESAKSYIQKNYQQDIKASDIAEEHLITPNYFSMLFKQETGYSYSEYLNMIRIKKATELLIRESNRIYEIAEYVGYKEYKYFAQIFKTQLGMTPTEYRRINVATK